MNAIEIACVLKYPERNGRTDGPSPWSLRQTGTYQKFDPVTRKSLWILLNPNCNASADQRVRGLVQESSNSKKLQKAPPPLIGLVPLAIYFRNWRSYMAFYEEEELRMVSRPRVRGESLKRLVLRAEIACVTHAVTWTSIIAIPLGIPRFFAPVHCNLLTRLTVKSCLHSIDQRGTRVQPRNSVDAPIYRKTALTSAMHIPLHNPDNRLAQSSQRRIAR